MNSMRARARSFTDPVGHRQYVIKVTLKKKGQIWRIHKSDPIRSPHII